MMNDGGGGDVGGLGGHGMAFAGWFGEWDVGGFVVK